MSIEMGREERDILDAGIDTLTREGVYLDEQKWDDWLALFVPD